MRGYYLKAPTSNQTIQQAIWVDTETLQYQIDPYTQGHILDFGWAAYKSFSHKQGWSKPQWLRFDTIDEYWEWVYTKLHPKKRLYMFCHNSNFDYPVLGVFTKLAADGWKPRKAVLEGPPTILQLGLNKKTMLLLDTLNWWRTSLASVGKALGIPKLDMPGKDATKEEWDTYCKRDVEIIMEAITKWSTFLREKDLGGFAPTIASQAMLTYRRKFMTTKILIDDNELALECSRSAYHGGRTEAFFIGKKQGSFRLVDVNSMYPKVMHAYKYPSRLLFYSQFATPLGLKAAMRKYLICARVRVRIKEPAIGIRRNKKLMYPVGEFDCQISTPEIDYVLKHGEIVTVYDMAMYKPARLFKAFVEYFYHHKAKAKQDGNATDADFYKKIMNSFYGKWGQNGIVYQEVYENGDLNPMAWEEIDADTGESVQFRQLYGVVYALANEGESSISHPAIAAHVTAYSRMYLFNLMLKAGRENVYYVDTDSLLVNDQGFERLKGDLHPTDLGKLDVEGHYDEITIHGAKDYIFGSKERHKGVSTRAEWYDENVVLQDKWSGLAGMIRAGNLSVPVTRQIIKVLKRQYDKGQVLSSGKVIPWTI